MAKRKIKTAKSAKKGAKKSAASRKSREKPSEGAVDAATREAFIKGKGVPMSKSNSGWRGDKRIDPMEGISVQNPADPYVPSAGSLYPGRLAIPTPEVSREMAPTSLASLIEQCAHFNKGFSKVFHQIAVVRARYEANLEPEDKLLESQIANLEKLASDLIQLRNSLATHYYRS